MPNWKFLLVGFAYQLSLGLWIGGGVILGALVAPSLFRTIESRSRAGELFGGILRKFARLRLVAVLVAISAAGVRLWLWEWNSTLSLYGRWIVLRWVCLSLMTVAVLYEIFYLEGALERKRIDLVDGTPAAAPERIEFQKLHKRAERVMKASLAAAAVALFFS